MSALPKMKKLRSRLLISFLLLFSIVFASFGALPAEAARKTADEIYVQPINGLDKTGFFGPTQKEIANALIMDNYKVFCAAPAQVMDAQIGNEYIRYLKLHGGETKDHTLKTTLNSPDEILQPLVTDDSGNEPGSIFNESKVSYVQSRLNEKPSDDPIKENLVTADYNKLLSFDEQLKIKQKAQKNIIYLCSKLDIPLSECPANITMPGTSMKIGEVKIPDAKDLLDKEAREKFMESNNAQGTANLPLAKYVKKPAYKVTCVEQNKSGASDIWHTKGLEDLSLYKDTNLGSLLSSLFGSLFHVLNFRKDECYVETIYIDANGTEDESWNTVEAHNLTRGFFNSHEETVAQEEEYQKRKKNALEVVLGSVNKGFTAEDRVNLVASANTQTKVIAHMINGTAPSCKQANIRTETAPTITTESKFAAGGARYKATKRTADQDWGMLDGMKNALKSIITTGERTKNDIENRSATVETFIIAPYDSQVTLDQFFSTKAEYEFAQEKAKSEWPTHVLFNKAVGEDQVYTLNGGTNSSSQEFYDPDKCVWKEGHYDKEGTWIPGRYDCTNRYGVTISGVNQEIGLPISEQIRSNAGRPLLAALSKTEDAKAYDHVEKYSSSAEANNEKLLKGDGSGSSNDNGTDDGDTEALSCEEYKNREVKLPTMGELMKTVCSIGGGGADSQLLWGLLQIEASPMLRRIRAGDTSMSCNDLILGSCAASGITGQLIPQCIDAKGCSQAEKIAEDTSDPWIQKIKKNPDIGCDITTQLKYTLEKRKSESNYLQQQYKLANGSAASTKQLYYMMAGRNYGVPAEYLSQPACGNYEAVDGCGGTNYCVCTMDTFKLNCSNIRGNNILDAD